MNVLYAVICLWLIVGFVFTQSILIDWHKNSGDEMSKEKAVHWIILSICGSIVGIIGLWILMKKR